MKPQNCGQRLVIRKTIKLSNMSQDDIKEFNEVTKKLED